MKPVRSGRTALIFSLLFLLFTAALSTVLYQTTKSNPSGTELSSYTLRIEAGKPTSLKSQYTFTVSCIFSESGAPCQEKSSQATVYPGIFSTITLSAPARSGSYRGIRVELLGHRGNPLQIRSVMLQDERIFDGRDISVFRNPQGLTISHDSASGLALLELSSDMASFELDAGFTVEGAQAAAIKYTSAVMAAVLFISGVLILSVFGASSGRGAHPVLVRRTIATTGASSRAASASTRASPTPQVWATPTSPATRACRKAASTLALTRAAPRSPRLRMRFIKATAPIGSSAAR